MGNDTSQRTLRSLKRITHPTLMIHGNKDIDSFSLSTDCGVCAVGEVDQACPLSEYLPSVGHTERNIESLLAIPREGRHIIACRLLRISKHGCDPDQYQSTNSPYDPTRGMGFGGVQPFFESHGEFSLAELPPSSIDSDAIHTCDKARSTEAKQLDDGIDRYLGISRRDRRVVVSAGRLGVNSIARPAH